MSACVQVASGLSLTRGPSLSNKGRGRAGRGLETFAAGDPGVVIRQRLGERRGLTQRAAAIGIARPQEVLRILLGEFLRVWLQRDDLRQAQPGDERVAIGECLGKEMQRIEKENGRRLVDLRDHVEENGGIGTEA